MNLKTVFSKKTLLASVAFLCIQSNIIKAQDLGTAGGYLDYVGKEFNDIEENTWDYTSSVAHGKSARKVEKRRKEVISANQDAIKKIKKLSAFNGSSAFRDSAISFLNTNYAVLNYDYAKIIDMEEVAEQSYDLMEAYMLAQEKANEKLRNAGEMISSEYKKFAEANNIKLIESKDKVAKNLDVANKVYKHYNEVYLIFFKSYKQEAYLLDAMQKGDVNGMEQNRNALVKTSTEGSAKVKEVKPYQGDASVKLACDQLLNFYKEEAEKKLKDASAFYVKKENFEKIKTAFDAKAPASRTKADVDQYNKAVNEYNQASNQFNGVINECNQKRSQLLDNWNKAAASFTDRHVPKK
ncbi:MAG: hypothetical protein JST26_11595 [Bacteroidetes bacterium]|nr:hypothetical protein [Bacteroidota bacterium]